MEAYKKLQAADKPFEIVYVILPFSHSARHVSLSGRPLGASLRARSLQLLLCSFI